MKRFLALIIVLLLLSGTFAGVYSASVLDTADKVEFEERIVYGDPSAAAGLHIRFFNEYSREGYYLSHSYSRYLWTTDFSFDGGGYSAETMQGYVYGDPRKEIPERIEIHDGFGSGSKNYLIDWDLVKRIREERAGELEEKGRVSIKLPAKTVFGFWPLDISVMQKSSTYSQTVYNGGNLLSMAFDEYFRFDIDEDITVYLNVPKTGEPSADFDYAEYGDRLIFGYGQSRYYGSLSYNGSLYFYLNFFKGEKLRDYSLVPGGYGIYKIDIPYTDGSLRADPESIDTLYSFGEGIIVRELRGSAKGNVINAFVEENDAYVLYSIDAESGDLIQRLPVCGLLQRNRMFVQQSGDCLVMGAVSDGTERNAALFVFKEDEKGIPSHELTADLGSVADNETAKKLMAFGLMGKDSYRNYPKYYDFIYLYEDGRLYFISADIPEEESSSPVYEPYNRCGISVVVCDESGPLFFGSYESSIGDRQCMPATGYRPQIWLER